MEEVDVVDRCRDELDGAGPFLSILHSDLHSTPERFDHRIVAAITDRSQAEPGPVLFEFLGECPRRELGPMIGMYHSPATGRLVL
jgi:hypothetical protein